MKYNEQKAQTQYDVEMCKSEDFKGEPSYKLVIHPDNKFFERGNKCKISIEISGAGDVDCAKLFLSLNLNVLDEEVTIIFNPPPGDNQQIMEDHFPLVADMPIYIFTNKNFKMLPTGYTTVHNLGEYRFGGTPVLSLLCQVKPTAPSGSHKLFLNLTYKSKNNIWYTDNKEVEIYIRYWYEYRRYLLLVLSLLVLSSIPGIDLLIDWIFPIISDALQSHTTMAIKNIFKLL